jgi:multiple antibiotic resistance protein
VTATLGFGASPITQVALAFIPLFVAMDVIGLLPIYLGMTGTLGPAERRAVAGQATRTAAVVGLGFLFLGDALLAVLGATVGDLQVAGGLLLLVFAVYDLLHPGLPLRQPAAGFGPVPLGVPLIAGPAVLTSLLTLARTQGIAPTLIGFALNLVLVWIGLRSASWIHRRLGTAGTQVVAKVANLLLAAIGVTFIREGITAAVTTIMRST